MYEYFFLLEIQFGNIHAFRVDLLLTMTCQMLKTACMGKHLETPALES